MNKARREKIGTMISELESIRDRVEGLTSEEQESFDSMPEGLKTTQRGEDAEEAINNLELAFTEVESLIDLLELARGNG